VGEGFFGAVRRVLDDHPKTLALHVERVVIVGTNPITVSDFRHYAFGLAVIAMLLKVVSLDVCHGLPHPYPPRLRLLRWAADDLDFKSNIWGGQQLFGFIFQLQKSTRLLVDVLAS
jgi:hypothetical protein